MTQDLTLILKAQDMVSRTLQGVRGSLGKLQTTALKVAKIGLAGLTAGFGILSGVVGASIYAFSGFETSITNVSTLLDGTATEAVDEYKKGILDMMKVIPKTADELGAGLYDVVSAGIKGTSNQLKVLKESAKLGVAGLGSTQEAVDLVTSSINAFGLEGDKADKVYDNIFKTVKNGKTTISELAQGFGGVAGTVAGAGIELDEYLASVAALTTTGLPAAEAHTQIKAAISGLTRETKASKKVFDALGAESFSDLIKKSGGMVPALELVTKELNGNESAILNLFGSTEAYNAVLGLTGEQNETFKNTLDSMRNGANAVDEAFQKQQATWSSFTQLLKNRVTAVLIKIGDKIAPKLQQAFQYLDEHLISKLMPHLEYFAGVVWDGLAKAFQYFTTNILPHLQAGFGYFTTTVLPLLQEGFEYLTTTVLPILIEKFNQLKDWFTGTGAPAISDFVQNTWGSMKQAFDDFRTNTLPLIMIVFEEFKSVIIEQVLPALGELWGVVETDLLPALMDLWNFIAPVLIPLLGGVLIGAILLVVHTFKTLIDLLKVVIKWFSETLQAIIKFVKGGIDLVVGVLTGDWERAWDGAKNIVSGSVDFIKAQIEGLVGIIGSVMDGIKGLQTSAGNIGKNFKIPGRAVGTSHHKGGPMLVGENGPELVNAPAGTTVDTATTTERKLSGGGGNNITFAPVINFSSFVAPNRSEQEKIKDNLNLEAMFEEFLRKKKLI